MFQNLPMPAVQEVCDSSSGVNPCIVMKSDSVLYHQVSPFSDLFTKVKELLRGTWYNTRDELIHAIVLSVWNTNENGCTDGVQRLPNIWQKISEGGQLYLRYMNVDPCE